MIGLDVRFEGMPQCVRLCKYEQHEQSGYFESTLDITSERYQYVER